MKEAIAFNRDRFNAPAFEAADDSYGPIGSLLTGDVQTIEPWCLDLLAWTEDVRAGRSAEETWQGDSWTVRITSGGVDLQDVYSDWEASYPLDTAHDVMLRYWRFLTGGAVDRAGGAVTEWEGKAGRAHPCRTHL